MSILLIIAYLFTRLTNLTLLPIFMDEANYLDWGWREVYNGKPWHSLYDGKQPLLMWIYGIVQTIPVDPLWITRAVSAFTGLITLLGLYKLSSSLWPPIVYTVIPIFVFYDRQALMESSLAAVGVWSLVLLIQLLKHAKVKTASYLGIVLGIGFFIKSTSLVFLLTVLVLLISKKYFWRNVTFGVIIITFFLICTLPLLLQADFWKTVSFNSRYSLTLSEIFRFPFYHWWEILTGNLNIVFWHVTPPVVLLALINLKKINKPLAFFIFFPLLLFTFTARSTNFRYLMPFLPLICLLVPKRPWVLVIPALVSLLLIFDPVNYFRFMSRLTKYSYIEGYLTGDSTGYQVMHTIAYLKDIANQQKIYIGLALNVGNPEGAILVYLRRHPNVTPTYLDNQLFGKQLENTDCLIADRPVYFAARKQQQGGLNKYFEPVKEIRNNYNSDYHTIYTLKRNCQGKSLMLTGDTTL